jgi:hypothetical protein
MEGINSLFHHVRNAVGEYARFARTGAGNDHYRAINVFNGDALTVV